MGVLERGKHSVCHISFKSSSSVMGNHVYHLYSSYLEYMITVIFSVGLSVAPTSKSPEMSLATCLKQTNVIPSQSSKRVKEILSAFWIQSIQNVDQEVAGGYASIKGVIDNGNCIIKAVGISNSVSNQLHFIFREDSQPLQSSLWTNLS